MTTIVEFRNSRKFVSKGKHDVFEDACLESCDEAVIYGYGEYDYAWGYIEKMIVYNMVDNKPCPVILYVLTLGCDEWINNSLAELEVKLFEWQTDNGAFEPTPSEMRQRLLGITREAMNAFWEVVAEGYPECCTGDLGPSATQDFEQSAFKVVTTWRDNNGGGQNVK